MSDYSTRYVTEEHPQNCGFSLLHMTGRTCCGRVFGVNRTPVTQTCTLCPFCCILKLIAGTLFRELSLPSRLEANHAPRGKNR